MAKETWSPAILKRVKSMVEKGLSTAEIGKKIGVSKNAVVGKLNRLGWNTGAPAKKASSKKPTPVKKVVAKKPAAKPKTPVKVVPKKVVKKPAPAKAPAGKPPVKKTAPVKPVKKAAEKVTKTPVAKKAEVKKPEPKASPKSSGMHQQIIQHSLEMANLGTNECRWPMGDPDTENFRFCGKPVFVGKPYCYDHCLAAYQMQPLKKK